MDASAQLGLYKFGENGWRQDGTDAKQIDANTEAIAVQFQSVQEEIENITISQLPPVIDSGSF